MGNLRNSCISRTQMVQDRSSTFWQVLLKAQGRKRGRSQEGAKERAVRIGEMGREPGHLAEEGTGPGNSSSCSEPPAGAQGRRERSRYFPDSWVPGSPRVLLHKGT